MGKFKGRSGEMKDMDESFYQRMSRYFYLSEGKFYRNFFKPFVGSEELRREVPFCGVEDLSCYFNQQIALPEASVAAGALGKGIYHIAKRNGKYVAIPPLRENAALSSWSLVLYKQIQCPVEMQLRASGLVIDAARLAWYMLGNGVPPHTHCVRLKYGRDGYLAGNMFLIPKSIMHLFRNHRNESFPTSQFRFVHRIGPGWGYDVQIHQVRYRKDGFETEEQASEAVEDIIWHWKRVNGYFAEKPKSANMFASSMQIEENLKALRHARKLKGLSGPDGNGFYRIRYKGVQLLQTRDKRQALETWWKVLGQSDWPELQELLEVHLGSSVSYSQ
jgi:hypothetical protein